MGWTIPMFAKYAQLAAQAARRPRLGRRLRAVRDAGTSASASSRAGSLRYVDAIYPMVYPSHYVSGEYNIIDPDSRPGTTVAYSLRDFRTAVRGRTTKLIPWLQDFSLRPDLHARRRAGPDPGSQAGAREGLHALERRRPLHGQGAPHAALSASRLKPFYTAMQAAAGCAIVSSDGGDEGDRAPARRSRARARRRSSSARTA